MIENWEIDRHETLLRRARATGGYLDGPDGLKVRIEKQEFPFDIGIWKNIEQGMCTRNVSALEHTPCPAELWVNPAKFLAWLLPFASSPSLDSGFEFEENDFNS